MIQPTMVDAIAAGEGTLHGAIDHWQEEATRWKAEATRMRSRIECLRGGLKSASGKFFEIGERGAAEDCMEWAGDMEPLLMGSNAEFRPTHAASSREVAPGTEG